MIIFYIIHSLAIVVAPGSGLLRLQSRSKSKRKAMPTRREAPRFGIHYLIFILLFVFLFILSSSADAQALIEIDGSPYATKNAMVPEYIKSGGEKVILIDPSRHAWGAYSNKGKLIRWGIATAGANWCSDVQKSCRTKKGVFRIYSLGNLNCASSKYPVAIGGAPMPYCMYFNGGQAIHGANKVVMGNKSHGCVRVYQEDAKWLRYQFVEAPNKKNNFRGTKVIVKAY